MKELRASATVAAKIRGYREFLGWSRREMAEHCGLSESVIENIESGRPNDDGERRRDVTIDELMMIADGLGIGLKRLLPDGALEPDGIDRDIAARRKRRRERQEQIANAMQELGELEATLNMLMMEQAAVTHRIDGTRKAIQGCRQRIKTYQAEFD